MRCLRPKMTSPLELELELELELGLELDLNLDRDSDHGSRLWSSYRPLTNPSMRSRRTRP